MSVQDILLSQTLQSYKQLSLFGMHQTNNLSQYHQQYTQDKCNNNNKGSVIQTLQQIVLNFAQRMQSSYKQHNVILNNNCQCYTSQSTLYPLLEIFNICYVPDDKLYVELPVYPFAPIQILMQNQWYLELCPMQFHA